MPVAWDEFEPVATNWDDYEPASPRYSDEIIADLPERERRRLDLLSELAAERGEGERLARREALFENYLYPAAEGALTALSLSPSAIARTVEKGVPATAAVVRGEERFTPAPPVVSGFLNPEIEGGTNALKIPHIPGGDSALTQIPAGLGNAVIEFANIFTTPEGILTLGIGGLPKGAQRAVVGTMAANMAAHYPEEFNAAVEAAKAGDLEQATRRIVATPVMASVMGRASMEPVSVPRAPEFPRLPDPDLVARNLAEPGTFRPQEQFGTPRIEPPAGMFEAGEVPFERMQRFSTMEVGEPQILPSTGPLPVPRIIEEARPKVQTETRGKVSFGAEAPTLLRTAIQGAEEVGLTKAAEAARKVQDASQVREAAEVYGDVRARQEGQGQVPAQESGARVQPQEPQVLLKPKLVAAIKTASGRTYTGERHPFALANAMDQIRETGGTKAGEMAAELADAQQGFVDVQSGQFLTRSEAAKKMGATGELTSEMIPEPELKANVAELQKRQPLQELRDLPADAGTAKAMELGAKVPKELLPELETLAKTAAEEANRVIAEIDAMPNPTTADLARMSETANRSQLLNEAVEGAKGGKPAILAREQVTTETATQPQLSASGGDLVLHLRDMESRPIQEVRLKSTGDPIRDAELLRAELYRAAQDNRVSLRESSGTTRRPDGGVALEFFETGSGMKWATPEDLAKLRQGGEQAAPEQKIAITPKDLVQPGKGRKALGVPVTWTGPTGKTFKGVTVGLPTEATVSGQKTHVVKVRTIGEEQLVIEGRTIPNAPITMDIRDLARDEKNITPKGPKQIEVTTEAAILAREKIPLESKAEKASSGGVAEPTIFGYPWSDIKAAQQGVRLSKTIRGSATRPKATEADYTALEKFGVEGLQRDQMFGILDRLGLPMEAPKSDIISKLEGMKFKNINEGKVFSLPHPDAIKAIGKQAWNDALDLAIGAVKAGRTVAEAVEIAWRHISKKGKFDEAQVRANLNYVVGEETKTPAPASAGAPPRPPSSRPPSTGSAPAPRPPSRGPATLDDIYKIFESDPKPSPTIKQRIVKASEAFRTGFSSAFRPLNKLAEDVAKSYGGTAKDVAGQFEQLKGSSGKAEADVYRFDQDVSKTVKGNEKDFNAYVFLLRSLDRLNRDIATGETRRKVSGYTVPELEAKLALLESKLTPNQRAQFQSAADNFQRHMDEALKLQVDSGRMAPEVYNAIKEGNQFYAPFKVMKYLEETSRPEGTGRRVDTPASFVKAMEGIESETFKLGDMLAAARQNISISRVLAEKNRAMQNITDLAALDTGELFVRKLKPGEQVPRDMEAVNVFENGVKERYAVNPDVAQAVQIHGPQSGTLLARIAASIFRVGATTFNVQFQPVNALLADLPRQALVSKYGLRWADFIRYPLDVYEAFTSSMMGNFGRRNKLYLDFLDSGAAGSTVQQFLTPEALRFDPSPQSRSASFAKTVLNSAPQFANAIEQTSKLIGVKRAMRFHGVESGKQLAQQIPEAITEVRRFSGSPDFGRSGKWTDQARLNLIYMFFNARVQGAVADIGRLGGRDGAKTAGKTWFKLGAAVGLPTLYAYLINNSDEYREDYAKRSDLEKRNYWLIPKDSFITSSSGEKMRDYWRIPKRESAKWMGNFVEAGMDFARQREPERFAEWAGRTLEDVFPVNIEGDTAQERIESVGASLNPLFKAPLEVATGRDMYRHKPIVPESMRKASPEQQYTDRTSQVFRTLAESMPDVAPEVFRSPLMLENMTKNVTAGLITQFLPRQPVEGRGAIENFPLTQRFQAVPYSDSTAFEERMQGLERESADEQLARFRNADELIKKMRGSTIDQIVKRSMELYGPDRKQVEKVVELWTATQRGVTPNERRILALPTQQRAQFIMGELAGKTPEEKAALLRDYSIKRILTEAVAEQMIEQQQPQR